MDLTKLTKDELKTLADSIEGFSYAANIGEDTLRNKLDEFIKANPDCIASDQTDDEEAKKLAEEEAERLAKEEADKEAEATKENAEAEKISKEQTDPKVELTVKENGLVDIKSIHKGEITTRFGVLDFGEDGLIEVKPEVAEYLLEINGYDKC